MLNLLCIIAISVLPSSELISPPVSLEYSHCYVCDMCEASSIRLMVSGILSSLCREHNVKTNNFIFEDFVTINIQAYVALMSITKTLEHYRPGLVCFLFCLVNFSHTLNFIFSSPVSLQYGVVGDNVMRPASSILRHASSVRSVTAKVLKIMSPDFMQNICAQSVREKLWWRYL